MRVDGSENDQMAVEAALRVMMDAEHIRSNPEMMKKVIALAEKQKGAIASIADLKDAYDRVVEEEREELPKKPGVKKAKEGSDEMKSTAQDDEIERRVKADK